MRESVSAPCLNDFWPCVDSEIGTIVEVNQPFYDIKFDNDDWLWFPADMLELEPKS